MKERRAYVVLVLLSLLFSILATAAAIHQNDVNERKFCDITRAVISKPVPPPANAATNPSREATYQLYLKFVTLDHRLGC